MQRGFSLVDLSIVLVILGLITGGILAGQSLIRAAEMRSVSAELLRYQSALYSFRDKYMALPGDVVNAERFWGTMATGTCPNATAGTGTQTCNGNGDGMVGTGSGASISGEKFQFWRQLANAGLVEGTYTGIAGSGGVHHAVIGTNVPSGRISTSGYSFDYSGWIAGSAADFPSQGHRFWFGGQVSDNLTYGQILKPEEAWNIDTKLDDGKPGYGKVMVWRTMTSCTNTNSGLSATADAAQAVYALTYTSNACALMFFAN